MHVAAVESTALATVVYDDGRQVLQLQFCSGAVYQYFGVPAAVHQALLSAPSKGSYFNEAIRGCFRHCLVNVADAPIGAGRRDRR